MPRIVVMDEELHELLTVVDIPSALMPTGRTGQFLADRIRFLAPEPVPFYTTPAVPMGPTRMEGRVVTLKLEPVYRFNHQTQSKETIFYYAYADNPELALLLRAAFLPGQVGEMQMREAEARIRGMWEGVGIGFDAGRRSRDR